MKQFAGAGPRHLKIGLIFGILAMLGSPATAEWKIESASGESWVKAGFLLQTSAQWLKIQHVDPATQNLYINRGRILLGGQVSPDVTFFMETDNPGYGKVPPGAGGKQFPDTYIQDFFATFRYAPKQFIDTGLLLTPGTYNHVQSAISLLALNYGPYTFVEAGPLDTKVGRDTGIQARGLLADSRLEYRAGLFQGVRRGNAAQSFRYAVRLAFHAWGGGSTDYFYTGSHLGHEAASIGVAAEGQKDYTAYHGDVFYERPITDDQTVTAQFDISSYDGGDWVPTLYKQVDWMAEGGYAFWNNKIVPYVQIAGQNYDDKDRPDHTQYEGGIGYRIDGNHANIKAAFTRIVTDGQPDQTLFTVQAQASMY